MTDKKARPPLGSERIPSLEEMGARPEECGVGHPHIDARILDACRLIVQRIDEDPERLQIAFENLERERARRGRLTKAREEWRAILDRPWAEIRTILLDGSDEGQRLRSSHPFLGIITQEEWRAILDRPWAEVRSILLDGSDEGQRLRSSHPFQGLISEEEGREIAGRHPPPWAAPGWKPPPPPSPELMARLLADEP